MWPHCWSRRVGGDSRSSGMVARLVERVEPARRREREMPRVWGSRMGRGVSVGIVVVGDVVVWRGRGWRCGVESCTDGVK